MRVDLQSRIKLDSGSLVIIPMENFQDILEIVSGKRYDDFETLKKVVDNNGDVIQLEPMEEISIGKLFTFDKDGGNSTILKIAPLINNYVRLLNDGEKTAQEYCMDKKKQMNIQDKDIVGFFTEQLKNYKKEMLGSEDRSNQV